MFARRGGVCLRDGRRSATVYRQTVTGLGEEVLLRSHFSFQVRRTVKLLSLTYKCKIVRLREWKVYYWYLLLFSHKTDANLKFILVDSDLLDWRANEVLANILIWMWGQRAKSEAVGILLCVYFCAQQAFATEVLYYFYYLYSCVGTWCTKYCQY